MPVTPDTSVFSKLQGFADYQRANQEFEQKKALQQAQIGLAQAQAQKALVPDYDEIGKGAFIQAATQGVDSLTPVQKAALLAADAKAQTFGFNPATGAMEQKPSMLDRAGIQLGDIRQPVQNSTIPALAALPTQPMVAPRPSAQPTMTKPEQDAGILDVYGDTPAQKVVLSTDAPEYNYDAEMKAKMQKELAGAAGNPKLQQTVREKYVNNNSSQVIFEKENKLRDEFTNTTKDFRVVQDAYSKIKKTSGTGAGDMSMLYQYVKLLDPGSVVRESEFASAAAAGSYGERVAGAVKGIVEGGRLNPSLRAEFINEADRIFSGQQEGYDRIKNTYTDLAKRNGLDVKNVVTDYAEPKTDKPKINPADAMNELARRKKL